MRRAVLVVATACVLAPLPRWRSSGGFYTQPRLVAAIAAWSLVLVLAVMGPAPLPRSRPGVIALSGLCLLTVWSAISIAWGAPLAGPRSRPCSVSSSIPARCWW